MINRTFTHLVVVSAVTFLCFANISGQTPGTGSAQRPDPPISQTVTLDKGKKQELTFNLRETGPITVQVFQDAQTTSGDDAAEQRGISGVKISLRSRDRGFENWVIEQYTDATGTYTFELLRPGKYKIEVDASTLPKSLQTETP